MKVDHYSVGVDTNDPPTHQAVDPDTFCQQAKAFGALSKIYFESTSVRGLKVSDHR